MNRKWWRILGFCAVVVFLIVGLVVGSLFLSDYLNHKEAIAKEPVVSEEQIVTEETKEITKETSAAAETTAKTEVTVIEESVTQETVAKETTEGRKKSYPKIIEEENFMPDNGNSQTISVGYNDLGFASMGPVEIFGMKFVGGQDEEGNDIGNIVIMQGTEGQKTNFVLNGVDNGNVYYKVVDYGEKPSQVEIDKLMNKGIIDFNKYGNGPSGDGVDEGYIIIVNPDGIQKTIYFEVKDGVIKVMEEVKL